MRAFTGKTEKKARGAVYMDGLNFYRRALHKTKFKWLDLQKWAHTALPSFNLKKSPDLWHKSA